MARTIENLENAFEEMFDFITDLPSGLDGFESDFDAAFEELKELKATLTPQNEALTIEQLREMDGEPVWVDDEKTWALLQVWDDQNIDAVFPMPRGCFHSKNVIGRKIYRRPPDRQEDT